MNHKILVTYASQYGATREIAEKIGQRLRQAGLQADVSPVDQTLDLAAYTGVVLGSGIYAGSWPKRAADFLRSRERSLAELPVWIFSSGPTDEGDPVQLLKGKLVPGALQPVVERIHPRDVTVFGGYIDPDRINFAARFVIKNLLKKPFGDFRNWQAIDAWAASVAEELKHNGR